MSFDPLARILQYQELININGEVERGGFLAVKELLFVR